MKIEPTFVITKDLDSSKPRIEIFFIPEQGEPILIQRYLCVWIEGNSK